MDSRIKFRHLSTFIEVARQRSVGKAADVLSISQPAVTRTIRELEEILAVDLFDKDGRGIKLSHFGDVFLRHAGESVASVQRGLDSLAEVKSSLGPPVRIGALPTASATFMPEVVADFLSFATGSPISIVTGENRWLLEALRVGDLDLVVGRMAPPERMIGLVFEPLYTEDVVFVVRAGHPLRKAKSFSLNDLSDFPVLMPTKGSVIRPFVDRLLLTNGIPDLPTSIETVSDSFGRSFVARHDAVWIISRGVVSAELTDGRFEVLDIDTTETRGAVGLTTRAGTELSPSLMLMMQAIRERMSARMAMA